MKTLIAIIALFFAPLAFGQAANVYLSQSGGSVSCNGGTQTTHAMIPSSGSFFNTSSNWGTGGSQIGPGTVVWICGTTTDTTAGDTLLSFQGSGTSGNPITLKFDTGASITNTAYWNNAINGSNLSYLVLDMGTNGVIQATGNGVALAYQQNSNAVQFFSCTHVTVQGSGTIGPTFISIAGYTNTWSGSTGGIVFSTESANDVVTGVNVRDAGQCVHYEANNSDTETGIQITNIQAYYCNWLIGIQAESGTISGAIVSGNNLHDTSNWDDPADNGHHNGIHFVTTGGMITGAIASKNWVHGNFGTNNTALLYFDAGSPWDCSQSGNYVLQNLFAQESGSYHGINNAYMTDGGCSNIFKNNTAYAASNTIGGHCVDPGPTAIFENNTCVNLACAIDGNGKTFTTIDYNNYYNVGTGGWNAGAGCSGGAFSPYWQGLGYDAHSNLTNPQLSTSSSPLYQPTSSSASALSAGANFYNTPAALNTDYLGNARPSSGNWYMGAYQYNGSPPPPTSGPAPCPQCFTDVPNPPTNLKATVSASPSSSNIKDDGSEALSGGSVMRMKFVTASSPYTISTKPLGDPRHDSSQFRKMPEEEYEPMSGYGWKIFSTKAKSNWSMSPAASSKVKIELQSRQVPWLPTLKSIGPIGRSTYAIWAVPELTMGTRN